MTPTTRLRTDPAAPTERANDGPNERPAAGEPVSMVGRVHAILRVFDVDSPTLTLTEIAACSGLPKSTVHRIVDQLVEVRWLERVGGRYRLGIELLDLGGRVAHGNRLRTAAAPHLHDLLAATRCVVHLGILDGTEVVYLERLGASRHLAVASRLGGRQPARCTGLGKAMLAFADEPIVEAALAERCVPRTPTTITDPVQLQTELATIRRVGYAVDNEEFQRGLVCVAAPIRSSGRAIAAISVAGPAHRIDPVRLATIVRGTAQTIWTALFAPRRD